MGTTVGGIRKVNGEFFNDSGGQEERRECGKGERVKKAGGERCRDKKKKKKKKDTRQREK